MDLVTAGGKRACVPAESTISAGRLVICCDHQDHDDFKNGNTTWSYSHVYISDDHGSSWRIGGSSSRTTNECAIAELENGTLVMNSRNYVAQQGARMLNTGVRE